MSFEKLQGWRSRGLLGQLVLPCTALLVKKLLLMSNLNPQCVIIVPFVPCFGFVTTRRNLALYFFQVISGLDS